MRIFVTGMTGFLGHELGQILLKKEFVEVGVKLEENFEAQIKLK